MQAPPIPLNEKERLKALHSLDILDTGPEEEFDNITRLAAALCNVPDSLISLVDANRQWFKSKVNLEACETGRDVSFCGHAINNARDEIFIIPDTRKDPRFSDNPLVKDAGISFYAGAPLIDENGYALGTLCVIDSKPNQLSALQEDGLKTLARSISGLLQLRKKNRELAFLKEYTLRTLTHASPYLLIVSRNGNILEMGDNFSLSIAEIKADTPFSHYFVWDRFNPEEIFEPNFKGNRLFYFDARLHKQRYKCSIRLFSPDSFVVFANPVVNENYPLNNYKVNLSHFAAQDYFSEFLFIQDSALRGLREVLELNDKISVKNRELEKTKSQLELAKEDLEKRVEERTREVTRMAYFPQQNPNPVLELNYELEEISYANPAAEAFFTGLKEIGFQKFIALLGLSQQEIQTTKGRKIRFEFGSNFMEGSLFFLPDSPTVRIYFHDLTEIRNAERDAEKSRLDFIRQQDVLLEIRSLPAALDFREKLKLISRRASSILGSQRSSIWFYTDDSKSAIHTEAVFLRETTSFSDSITLNSTDFPGYFNALLSQNEIVATDAHKDPATREFSEVYLKPLGICSMLDVPIRRQNEVFGVLCSEYTGNELKNWSEGEIAFANSIADAISLAFETEQLKISQKNLQEKSESLEDAMQRLIEVQGDMIRQEKLATLGLLIAGIAHEINTPLGAIKASNQTVKETLLHEIFSSLVAMSQDDFRMALELFRLYRPRTEQLSTREERSRLRELEDELSRRYPELQQPSRYARIVLEMGYSEIEPVLYPYFEMKEKKDIFNFTLSLVRMNKSVGTIEIAVDKAAKVVKALNNFSHGNLEQEMADFVLRDNVESVITILWNKIKAGASVKLEVSPEVSLYGNQEELAQVWTNLINNALQASNNKCNIRIRHWLVGNWHHIRFSNDGPPIPEEVLPRIFDAFFTTKKQGEGTGLGLNISKQIIEKHGGQIKVESGNGETAFEIILPLNRNLN
jgi:signal transduction histidine kinase